MSRSRRIRFLSAPRAVTTPLSLAVATFLLPVDRAGAEAGAVTYAEHVEPILAAACVDCHRPGQIGPMSLTNYEEVRPWAKSIRRVVTERTMPPWHADPAHGQFASDRSLSEEKIAAVASWVDSGAPLGDASKLAPPRTFDDEGWMMGEPDQVFTMVEPHVVADEIEDKYEVFIIPSGLTEDKWVTATELKAGAPDAVHHILVFIALPGIIPDEKIVEVLSSEEQTDDSLDPRVFQGGLFAKYAPGANPEIWPPGYGRKLPAGCLIVFQNHYHKEPGAGTARTDRSSLAVKFADGPVEHPITTAWLAHFFFEIEPGAKETRASSLFKFIDDGKIHALAPHLHLRGKEFVFEANYPDGSSEILLRVPRYDFNWQTSYILAEPKVIPKGTTIRATGVWDNSAENPNNPDPSKKVVWGNASTDEMMIGFMDYTYDTKKRFQGMFGAPEGVKMDPFGFGANPPSGGGSGNSGE